MDRSSTRPSRLRGMLSKLGLIWRNWARSPHPDRESAFRERTLRISAPLFILLDLLNIIWIIASPSLPDSRVVVWLVYILVSGVSIWLMVRGHTTAAGVLVACVVFLVVGIAQVRQGYWSGYTYTALGIGVVFCALVLPRRLTAAAALALSVEYAVITFWQDGAGVPYPNPLRDLDALAHPLPATLTGVFYLLAVVVLGFTLLDEFISRAADLRQQADTLEQRVAERTAELEAAYEQVKRLNHTKDEFVSNVSHELRTPITSILLTEHVLEQQATEEQRIRLARLKRETERLKQLIDALLFLSRMDQEQVSVALAVVDVNTLVEEYANDRAALVQDRGLALDAELSPEGPRVWADSSLLGMVLSILLTNAFNYTPPGGQVTIKAEAYSDNGMHWAGFSVKDTGPGIAPDEQPLLFDRFYRGKAARSAGAAGTGLGLSIAREIVERHHGRIVIESSGVPGQGSLFKVWLPRLVDDPDGTAGQPAPVSSIE